MSIIGITGNIGSGKSYAAAYLAELGAARIDADRVGHEVIAKGGSAYQGVLEAFGNHFLDAAGEIDRRALGAYVFADSSGGRLQLLNSLTHPHIFAAIETKIAAFRADNYAMIVLEAALLFDSQLLRFTDENWLISAPRHLLLRRAAARDNSDEQAIAARLDQQRSQEELARLADRVIVNDGSLEQFRQRLAAAYQQCLAKSQ